MYMDNIKLFAKNEKGSENIQSGHWDGIWHRNMPHANMKSGKGHKTEGMELPNQEKIRTLGEKETYQY